MLVRHILSLLRVFFFFNVGLLLCGTLQYSRLYQHVVTRSPSFDHHMSGFSRVPLHDHMTKTKKNSTFFQGTGKI